MHNKVGHWQGGHEFHDHVKFVSSRSCSLRSVAVDDLVSARDETRAISMDFTIDARKILSLRLMEKFLERPRGLRFLSILSRLNDYSTSSFFLSSSQTVHDLNVRPAPPDSGTSGKAWPAPEYSLSSETAKMETVGDGGHDQAFCHPYDRQGISNLHERASCSPHLLVCLPPYDIAYGIQATLEEFGYRKSKRVLRFFKSFNQKLANTAICRVPRYRTMLPEINSRGNGRFLLRTAPAVSGGYPMVDAASTVRNEGLGDHFVGAISI
ncbi:hypothetical protein BS47DRAFT_1400177 [Hydnum rufescens UP504]|uniref:Uncharacterized protein n=1 Tax=Hydnum rufescens UP504 TaxID=1448309 RepID=A0A9P6DNX6_9AGAM|nr:hypothetical protein BS47DRAFT_1400177 [Hydnum rufescens UP504]